jgi:hypothetical protein
MMSGNESEDELETASEGNYVIGVPDEDSTESEDASTLAELLVHLTICEGSGSHQ